MTNKKMGQKVKIIGGNNEPDQPSLIGKVGQVVSFGLPYFVKGKETKEVYVKFEHHGLHVFNDCHLL